MYDNYVLTFLNKYGAFESVLFNKASKKSLSIEHKSFNKLPYKYDNSNNISWVNNNIANEQKVVFAKKFTEKIKLHSDNLTDAEYNWLFELVCSPMVYIQKVGESYIRPCVITNSNYDFNRVLQDDLTNLTLDIEFGTTIKTQFR